MMVSQYDGYHARYYGGCFSSADFKKSDDFASRRKCHVGVDSSLPPLMMARLSLPAICATRATQRRSSLPRQLRLAALWLIATIQLVLANYHAGLFLGDRKRAGPIWHIKRPRSAMRGCRLDASSRPPLGGAGAPGPRDGRALISYRHLSPPRFSVYFVALRALLRLAHQSASAFASACFSTTLRRVTLDAAQSRGRGRLFASRLRLVYDSGLMPLCAGPGRLHNP